MGGIIPIELVRLARNVIEKATARIHCGGSVAYVQLIASELYEALQLELGETPPAEAAKRGVLAAAIDQCRRSMDASLGTSLRVAQLEATAELLERGAPLRLVPGGKPRASEPMLRFRVIEGGLSKSA